MQQLTRGDLSRLMRSGEHTASTIVQLIETSVLNRVLNNSWHHGSTIQLHVKKGVHSSLRSKSIPFGQLIVLLVELYATNHMLSATLRSDSR